MMSAHDTWKLENAIRLDKRMIDITTEWACKGQTSWDTVGKWEKSLSDDIDRLIAITEKRVTA